MPPKTVRCFVCGQEVSKRSTLLLGDKRACRTHPEVEMFLSEQEQAKQKLERAKQAAKDAVEAEKEQWAEVNRAMRVLSLAAGIRMFHTLHGIPEDVLYNRVRLVGGTSWWGWCARRLPNMAA